MSSLEENKAISDRSYEKFYHKRNIDLVDEFYDENIIAHTNLGGIKNLETESQLVSRLPKAFKGLKLLQAFVTLSPKINYV